MKSDLLYIAAILGFIGLFVLIVVPRVRCTHEEMEQARLHPPSVQDMELPDTALRYVEIDGCEYILYFGVGKYNTALTHKGNCVHCEARRKAEAGEACP